MNGNTPIFGYGSPADIARIEARSEAKKILANEDMSHWKNPKVGVGDTVFYQIAEGDIEEFGLHLQNKNIQVGDLMPAIITRLFDGYTYANMVLFVDSGVGGGTCQLFSRSFLGRMNHGR